MSNVKIVSQYIKDLSFKVPNAPEIYLNPQDKPDIGLSIDIDAKKIEDSNFEIVLKINADAKSNGQELFNLDITYGGIFAIGSEIEGEMLEQILLIYCPNMLFPYMRRAISDLVADAGFSPLMLDPIDFAMLYSRRKAAENSTPESDSRN